MLVTGSPRWKIWHASQTGQEMNGVVNTNKAGIECAECGDRPRMSIFKNTKYKYVGLEWARKSHHGRSSSLPKTCDNLVLN